MAVEIISFYLLQMLTSVEHISLKVFNRDAALFSDQSCMRRYHRYLIFIGVVVSIMCFCFLFCAFWPNGVCYFWYSFIQCFLYMTSSFSNKHPLEIQCSYSVGGAYNRERKGGAVGASPVLHYCGLLFENNDVTERKHSNTWNKLHWVKTHKKSQNTQWRLLESLIIKFISVYDSIPRLAIPQISALQKY